MFRFAILGNWFRSDMSTHLALHAILWPETGIRFTIVFLMKVLNSVPGNWNSTYHKVHIYIEDLLC